jgi:spermidine synthase
LFASFFFSGASALIYEVVASRLLLRVLGATLLSTTVVLTIFMGGLAAGAFLSGRLPGGKRRRTLLLYGWLELGIGLSGAALCLLFSHFVIDSVWPFFDQLAGANLLALTGLRCLFALTVLAVPTCLMGATLPAVCNYFSTERVAAQEVNKLYWANTCGAVLGTAAGGFILVPALGLSGALLIAAAVNLLVGSISLYVLRFVPEEAATDSLGCREGGTMSDSLISGQGAGQTAGEPAWQSAQAGMLTACVFFSGALAMMLEVVWIRLFCLIFGSTIYAFSCVLAVYLAGLSAGCGIAARWRTRPGGLTIASLLLAAGAAVYLGLWFLTCLPQVLVWLEQCFSAGAGSPTFAAACAARFISAAIIVVPPAALTGAILPLCLRASADLHELAAKRMSYLYGFNLLGAIAGAWFAGFVAIPTLAKLFASGMQMTMLLVASAEIGLAALVIVVSGWHARATDDRRKRSIMVPALLFALPPVAFFFLRPPWDAAAMSSGISFSAKTSNQSAAGEDLLFYREGLNTTVTVGRVVPANVIYLKNDGKVDVSLPLDPDKPAPSCDLGTQVLLGELPALIHTGPVREVLLVGYGSGTTAGSLLRNPQLEKLTVVELEDAVMAADVFFRRVNNNPLSSRRSTVKTDDGRSVLASGPASLSGKYDCIVSQPSEPWVAGSGDLFSQEFWQIGRSSLKPGGVFCQWVQLYGLTPEYLACLCRTFGSVFPETIVFHQPGAGEIILVGFNGTVVIDCHQLAKRFSEPDVKGDLARAGIRSPGAVLDLIVQGPPELRAFVNDAGCKTHDHRLNTDDNLLLEYRLPQDLVGAGALVEGNLAWLGQTGVNLAEITKGAAQMRAEQKAGKPWVPFLERGQFAEAYRLLAQAAQRDSNDPEIQGELGLACVRLKRYSEGEQHLRAALTLDPSGFKERLLLAKILLSAGRKEEGLEELKTAAAVKPGNPEPPLVAALFFIKLGSYDLARENIRQYEKRVLQSPLCKRLLSLVERAAGGTAQDSNGQKIWHLSDAGGQPAGDRDLAELLRQEDLER